MQSPIKETNAVSSKPEWLWLRKGSKEEERRKAMCHTIIQRGYHFPQVIEGETGNRWLMGYKRFYNGDSGLRFLHMYKEPTVAMSERGATISCEKAACWQDVAFQLSTTKSETLEVTRSVRAAIHVSPLEKFHRFPSQSPILHAVVLFRPEDIVFFDGVDISVKKVLIPRDFVKDFVLSESEFPLDVDKLNTICLHCYQQFQAILKAMERRRE